MPPITCDFWRGLGDHSQAAGILGVSGGFYPPLEQSSPRIPSDGFAGCPPASRLSFSARSVLTACRPAWPPVCHALAAICFSVSRYDRQRRAGRLLAASLALATHSGRRLRPGLPLARFFHQG